MSSTSPDGPPRRRTGIGRIVFSVIAVLTVLAASAFSIRSASGGNDIRTNLTLIAPAAAGGGWDSFQRELQQTCLLYTSPSPRDGLLSRMPSSA